MSRVEYTPDQLRAIEGRGRNLLVSAAAGSGKTAVLVERIVRRVTDPVCPVDVDHILVLTFTNAAAAQMKEKIYKEIEGRRAEDPADPNLQKQAALIHNAMITTIHGFCLSVLKNHFNEAGITADFRVADEGECRLIKQDALAEILEEKYRENSPDFIEMVETIAYGKTDRILEDIVFRFYEFATSSPQPKEWMDRCLSVYKDFADEEKSLTGLPIIKDYYEDLKRELSEIREGFQRLLRLTEDTTGLDVYRPTIDADISVVELLLRAEDIEGLFDRLKEASFVRFGKDGRKGDPKPAPEDKIFLQERRDILKDRVKKLKDSAARFDPEKNRKLIGDCVPVVSELISLTEQFAKRYEEKKREAGVIDYSDMEHLTLRVFSRDNGAAAGEYRELYEEVYVDEYQDSNLVQETILQAVSRGDNLFMVGDVKQSIYSFRLARPDIFVRKYDSYANEEGGLRIDLSVNFRSRAEVLDSVNEVFSTVMRKETAGIEYDENARLICGATEYGEREEDPSPDKTELILIRRQENETDEKELEAEVVSEKILGLMSSCRVNDPDTGGSRNIRYRDIVILLRTAKDWSETFSKVLRKNGIPVQISSKTGYFAAYEVALLLDFLKVLDNPRQDIPLAAVLLGAFGRMTDSELALIRGQNRDGCLYDALRKASESEKKAADFLSLLDHYREKTGYTGIYDLLREIVDSGYGRYVAAMENGKQRLSNLNMLLQKAEDYAKTSYKGLFQFVRYIDMLKKYEIDYGESTTFANEDAVRIMTIHNSKGLEFPVCFVAGLGKKYNFADQRAMVVLDAEYGAGMDRVDIKKRTRTRTLLKEAIIRKGMRELRAEEMRLLYVAMTRAKEKLILTGCVRDPGKASAAGYIGLANIAGFSELLMYADNIAPFREIEVQPYELKERVRKGVERELYKNEAYLRLREIDEGKADYLSDENEELSDLIRGIREKLEFCYETREDGETLEKFSVTELKKRHLEQLMKEDKETGDERQELFGPPPGKERYIPAFIRGVQAKTVSGNLHGSAVHRLFELWDYKEEATGENVRNFLTETVARGRMEQKLADSVTPDELLGFFQSGLAGRMREAEKQGKLYREQPFVIRLDGQLIQGIIDAFFIEDDKIIVVDYKTDRVNRSTELIDRYELQLEYYARALNILLGLPVKEKIIYSTVLNQSILL